MERSTKTTTAGIAGQRTTVVTWEEYLRLCRDSEILDWIEDDYARRRSRGGPHSLREMVGELIDCGAALKGTLRAAALDLVSRSGPTGREGPLDP